MHEIWKVRRPKTDVLPVSQRHQLYTNYEVSVYSLWRYESWRKMQKLGWFGGLGVTQGHRKHSHSKEHIQLVLNSRVTEPNLTKFLQDVQKWLPISLLKSILRSSNPFRDSKVTNEDSHQIAAKIARYNSDLNSWDYWTEVHQICTLCSQIIAEWQHKKGDWSAKYADFSTLNGCHSNVYWEIASDLLGYLSLPTVYQSWNFGEDRSIRLWDIGSRKSTIKN